jgi:hypothetical protein
MDQTKNPFVSRTLIGIGVAFAAQIINRQFGTDIDSALQTDIVSMIADSISMGGMALAVYGRVKATKRIGVKKQ